MAYLWGEGPALSKEPVNPHPPTPTILSCGTASILHGTMLLWDLSPGVLEIAFSSKKPPLGYLPTLRQTCLGNLTPGGLWTLLPH